MASDTKPVEEKPAEQKPEQKPTALGEDDEFEDFPVDGTTSLSFPCHHTTGPAQLSLVTAPPFHQANALHLDWPEDQTEAAQGSDPKHLWEESWDDDDTTDDFSAQLKEELKKVEAAKRR
ncbi:hypothetical protein B0J13DRAFT_107076 [Dactylonectria estremocensis]|uniref:26S proteasome complex subunit SEM1 n=1 Tax=Dactylonectria estremocensis TaxID=1079267 RepID=A0A9P9E6D0_9HYPO|nr:hypothetical protein B0J13DRAFT_107076 [Dactylonectria estremocensis]